MEQTDNNLKKRRTLLTLTLEQVVEKTRIRKEIIEQIEQNNTDAIPLVYLSAYKKTLSDFYDKAANNKTYLAAVKNVKVTEIEKSITNIPYSPKDTMVYSSEDNQNTSTNNFETPKLLSDDKKNIPTKNKKDIENKKNVKEKKETHTDYIVEVNKDEKRPIIRKYKQNNLINFNKRIFKKTLNITIKDLMIYICGAVVIGLMIFFVFIYDTNSKEIENIYINDGEDNLSDSIISGKDIFSYFNNDSVVLVAKCNDTASVKVEIDNKKIDDMLMTPGMTYTWSAAEKIILTTTNVGGIDFYKNDTALPMLGPKGTMVQNIVITKEGVKNINPLSSDNNPISVKDLKPNQNEIVPSTFDTIKPPPPKQYAAAKKKKEEPPKPIIIDFSKPTMTKPPILEN